MPFALVGNLDKIDKSALDKIAKTYKIILSPNQTPLQQKRLLQRGLENLGSINSVLEKLSKKELLSLIFIITQFGDISLEDIPEDYSNLSKIPYVIEWSKNQFMIPLEFFENLAHERIFKEQNYLFALLHTLSKEEKKNWLQWIGAEFDKTQSHSIEFEIYSYCRTLQRPFDGKSLVQESEFLVTDMWPVGTCQELDWFYKGLTGFYYSCRNLSLREKDPFKKYVLDLIRSGKLILKIDKYSPNTKASLVSTVEGSTPQLRKSLYSWELEKNLTIPNLFNYQS